MARISKFTAENIVAILNAAKDGGTVESVLERSGTNVAYGAFLSWVTRGHRDSRIGAKTAHGKFADYWDAIRLADASTGPWSGDPMTEIDKALEILEAK